jgi:hypothetical protein
MARGLLTSMGRAASGRFSSVETEVAKPLPGVFGALLVPELIPADDHLSTSLSRSMRVCWHSTHSIQRSDER